LLSKKRKAYLKEYYKRPEVKARTKKYYAVYNENSGEVKNRLKLINNNYISSRDITILRTQIKSYDRRYILGYMPTAVRLRYDTIKEILRVWNGKE